MKQKTIFTIIVCLVVTMMMAQETRYVDLGLPSGILWADQNEPGVYTFEETTEKYSGKEMPGMREFQELVDQCTWKWNGNGYTVIGTNGDSIILPMESIGDCQGNMSKETTRGYYWSAEAYDELEGWGLYFSPDKVYTNMSFIKCMALPVRKIQHPAETFLIPDYDKIQSIGFAIIGGVIQLDSGGFDGDATLPLQVHGVQQLLAHLALVDGLIFLHQPVGQCGLAMVNMGNNGKIPDLRKFGHMCVPLCGRKIAFS
jgi:hypothetical protein